MSVENGKVCCSCRHNIRSGEPIKCHCEVDGHYIGYIECMTHWCRHWARDRKWDENERNTSRV